MRRVLVAAAVAAAAVGGGTAHATNCFGLSGTYVVCEDNRTAYSGCVYTGGTTCRPVVVNGPLCVSGGNASSHFQTVWC